MHAHKHRHTLTHTPRATIRAISQHFRSDGACFFSLLHPPPPPAACPVDQWGSSWASTINQSLSAICPQGQPITALRQLVHEKCGTGGWKGGWGGEGWWVVGGSGGGALSDWSQVTAAQQHFMHLQLILDIPMTATQARAHTHTNDCRGSHTQKSLYTFCCILRPRAHGLKASWALRFERFTSGVWCPHTSKLHQQAAITLLHNHRAQTHPFTSYCHD